MFRLVFLHHSGVGFVLEGSRIGYTLTFCARNPMRRTGLAAAQKSCA
jgi:hypothetical protein